MALGILYLAEHSPAAPVQQLLAAHGFRLVVAGPADVVGALADKPDLVLVSSPEAEAAFRGALQLTAAAGIPALSLPGAMLHSPLLETGLVPVLCAFRDGKAQRSVLDGLPFLIAVFEPSLEIRSLHGKLARLLGFDSEGPPGKGFLSALFTDAGEMSHFREFLEEANGGWRHFQVATREGSAHTCWTAFRLEDGAVAAVAHEDSERQRREDELRANDQRLASILRHGAEMVALKDAHGKFIFISDSVESVLGYAPEEYLRLSTSDMIHPEDLARVRHVQASLVRQPGRRAAFECRARHADGSWRCLSITNTNCLHVKGVEGIVANARDITEQKLAQGEFLDSQDRLRHLAARLEAIREEERTTIAREVHDEIGQMLTALKMETEGLEAALRQNGIDAGILRRAGRIVRQIDAGIDSVRRIAAELRPGILDHLGLGAAIQWQADQFTARTGLHCRILAPIGDPPLLPHASTAVFRIFQEILTNVARHSGATTVGVRLHQKGSKLVLEVRDNGRGIEESKITDPGSLGLIGMRERALALGGTILFRRSSTQGTTVVLQVPIAVNTREPARGGATSPAEHNGVAEPRRILIADDHVMVRKGLGEILVRTYPQVSIGEAGDGQQALEMLACGHWDLLILDISMPVKSGLEVLAELKHKGAHIPVLVLSMYAEPDFARRVLDMGAAGFVHKSTAAHRLVGAIGKVLAGQKYLEGPAATLKR